MAKLSEELAERSLSHLVETPVEVCDLLRAKGLERDFGRIDRSTSIADAIEHFDAREKSTGGHALRSMIRRRGDVRQQSSGVRRTSL
jgi:hypothetical protein